MGGCKSASASVVGAGVYGRLKFEAGIHRVQRVPATEKSGRVHTSAASVAILPQAEEVCLTRSHEINMQSFCLRAGFGPSAASSLEVICSLWWQFDAQNMNDHRMSRRAGCMTFVRLHEG